MDIRCYIAMTAQEFRLAKPQPKDMAWLSCHFSPEGDGLSNLPEYLPTGSVLIVDDYYPPNKQRPELVARQLSQIAERFALKAVILDFQIPGVPKTVEMVNYLTEAIPCPICVAAPYAENLTCPVLTPPPPLHVSPKKHFHNWRGRELWLETALEAQKITVTEQGSMIQTVPYTPLPENCFTDANLCCKYQAKIYDDRVEFTLVRDTEMARDLLRKSKDLGVRYAVALYQQHLFL